MGPLILLMQIATSDLVLGCVVDGHCSNQRCPGHKEARLPVVVSQRSYLLAPVKLLLWMYSQGTYIEFMYWEYTEYGTIESLLQYWYTPGTYNTVTMTIHLAGI